MPLLHFGLNIFDVCLGIRLTKMVADDVYQAAAAGSAVHLINFLGLNAEFAVHQHDGAGIAGEQSANPHCVLGFRQACQIGPMVEPDYIVDVHGFTI